MDLKDLQLMLDAFNYLDIAPLHDFCAHVLARRLFSPAFFGEFIMNPELFCTTYSSICTIGKEGIIPGALNDL